MKGMTKTLLALVGLGFILGTAPAMAEMKIGVVKVQEVLQGYDKSKNYNEELKAKNEALTQERDQMVNELKKMEASLELLGGAEKEKKIKELQEKQIAYRQQIMQKAQELDATRDGYLKEVLMDLQPVVDDYAKKNKYDLIINGDLILYHNSAIDITQDIIDMLNKNYNQKK